MSEMTLEQPDKGLDHGPAGVPARWQGRYKGGPWENISERQYRSLMGDWDYELRTINVVTKAPAHD